MCELLCKAGSIYALSIKDFTGRGRWLGLVVEFG